MKSYQIYKSVIKNALADTEYLPSLPTITLKIRQAISNPDTSTDQLATLISADPALCALIIRTAASPLYKTRAQVSSLSGTISVLGLQEIDNLVMIHSVKSLFTLQSPALKTLFNKAWRRIILKSSIASFLAMELKCNSRDQVVLASILSEVGTLAILSAFKDTEQTPSFSDYVKLCQAHSKSLGSVLLNKWSIGSPFSDTLKYCGNWEYAAEEELGITDVVNLALHTFLSASGKKDTLPDIETLSAYQKLPAQFQDLTSQKQLKLLAQNSTEIKAIVSSLT